MPRLSINSLGIKIGAAIVLAQVLVLSIIGVYYSQRFSQQLDDRVQTQIRIPGALMNAGLLNYEAIDDHKKMRTIVGNDVNQALIIGVDRTIFHASDSELVGKNVQDLKGFDPSWVTTQYSTQHIHDSTGSYLISVTPIVSGSGGQTPFLFLFLKINTNSIQSQKTFIKAVFFL